MEVGCNMAKRKRTIITNNKEIHEKLNLLNFSPEVLLRDVKKIQIEKIVNNINRTGKILDIELLGDYIIIKKINPINYNIYLNK